MCAFFEAGRDKEVNLSYVASINLPDPKLDRTGGAAAFGGGLSGQAVEVEVGNAGRNKFPLAN